MVNLYYFPSTDKAWLDGVNQRGLPSGTQDGTTKWVTIHKHPDREEWAAELQDDYLPRLSEILDNSEYSAVSVGLKTKEQMNAEGWNL